MKGRLLLLVHLYIMKKRFNPINKLYNFTYPDQNKVHVEDSQVSQLPLQLAAAAIISNTRQIGY